MKSLEIQTYYIWSTMRQRCNNPNCEAYQYYGGRGITVCARWDNFDNFVTDVGIKPSSKHSLDRINNDGHYEPSNCRWETAQNQANNRSNAIRITAHGKTKSIRDWSNETGLSFRVIQFRLWRGWLPEDIISQPKRLHRKTTGRYSTAMKESGL